MKRVLFLLLLVFSVTAFSKAIFKKSDSLALKAGNPDFVMSCAVGLIEGCKVIRKFGFNLDLPNGIERDVWEFGGISAPGGNVSYTYPTDGTAPISTISSDDVLDTQEIILTGLTIDGTMLVQSKTLNGQNKVVLDTPLWRIYRVINNQQSSTSNRSLGFNGSIYVYEDTPIVTGRPTDLSKVRAYIFDGNNQTQMTHFTMEKGWSGLVFGISPRSAKKTGGTIIFRAWVRPFGGVFRLVDTGASSDQPFMITCQGVK